MKQQFFSLLGDELYHMKNSPFMRIGQAGLKNNSRVYQKGLSFDPDRLFNPDRRKEQEEFMDDEIIENHRKEREQLESIQYDLLKKNTDEQYQKLIKKMQAARRYDHKHPYSWFGVYRGACLLCDSCGEYEGCFTQGLRDKGIQIMECCKCRCPMNSHIAVPDNNPFYSQIWQHLIKRDMVDSDIKINYKILAFKVPNDKSHDYGGVADILKQIGYEVKDITIESKLRFQVGLVKSTIIKNGAKDWYVESLLSLLNSIAVEDEWNWQQSRVHINQSFEDAYQVVKKIVLDLPFRIAENQSVFVALCTYNNDNSQNLYKFLKTAGEQVLGDFKFIWGPSDRKQSLISAQNFFPSNYEIQYQIFLLPSVLDQKQAARNSARFRDVLDYNGYTLFMEDINNLDRHKFQKVFQHFSGSKINYLLGEEILSQKIKRMGIKLTARIGPSRMIIPFDPCPDFVTMGQQSQIQKAMLSLYPEFSCSQRCVIVIRPFVLNANFEETIVNLLRINHFVVIKRLKIKISQAEASYMGTLEGITDQRLPQYITFMTAGVCELVLVSKRSAIYDAYALSNGCLTGPTYIPSSMFKQAPTVQLRKGKDHYDYEFGSNPIRNPQIFSSLRETIGIESVLFGNMPAPHFMTNSKTGEIVKVSSQFQNQQQQLRMPQKMKASLLKSLRKDPFNYWMFTSKSQTISEELAGLFLPECTLFEPITVIVKPGLVHLVPAIKKVLAEHKFHINTERQVLLDKITAAEFIFNCQKIMLPKETLRMIIETYSSSPVHILCLSKISGRKEIMSMLADFSFYIEQTVNKYQGDRVEDSMLREILVPVWNNEELILRLVSQPLGNLQESIKSLQETPETSDRALSKSQRYMLLEYLVGSFYGVNINDIDLNTRLGKLKYYVCDDTVPIESGLRQQQGWHSIIKQQSWYYALISQNFPNYVPLLFQYRQLGKTLLCIQTDNGQPFLDRVLLMYEQQQAKLQKKADQPSHKKKRRSLVLFLWAKKMHELVSDLSEVMTQLKGFGQIWDKDGEYQGNYSEAIAGNNEKQLLNQILKQQKDDPQVSQNIKKLLNSRHLKQRYLPGNRRLLPSFSLQGIKQCIRVVQKTDTTKLHLVDKFSFIDPDNEKNNLKDLYTLNLYNIVPEIKTKYSMAAEIYYYILMEQFVNSQENPKLSDMLGQLSQMLTDLFSQVPDLDILEYEIYLRFLVQFSYSPNDSNLKGWLFSLIRRYPNLKKSRIIDHDEGAGKKRKFLDHKQYFIRKNEGNEESIKKMQKEYMNFDLNTLKEPMKANPLYDPNDPLHQRFAKAENRTNLLREGTDLKPIRQGIYVQFEKNISEKEELLKQKIKKEVQRFNVHKNDEILHQTGLEKQLWYRKARGGPRPDRQSKVNEAIQRQIAKFVSFKESEQKKISERPIQ